MIDYIFTFTDKATALADSNAVGHFTGTTWNSDHVQEITVWRTSQDTVDGSGNTVHTPLAGYWLWVSWPKQVTALTNHANLKVAIDRERLTKRLGSAIIKSNVSNAILQDVMISPVYMGCDFPWGSMN